MAQELKAYNVIATADVNPEVVDILGCTEWAGYDKDEVDAVLVEKDAENRKLQRALWLARAKRAEARKNYWYARSCHEGDKDVWSIDGSAVKYIGCIKRTNFDWLKTWSEVECKCRAKAEEFR